MPLHRTPSWSKSNGARRCTREQWAGPGQSHRHGGASRSRHLRGESHAFPPEVGTGRSPKFRLPTGPLASPHRAPPWSSIASTTRSRAGCCRLSPTEPEICSFPLGKRHRHKHSCLGGHLDVKGPLRGLLLQAEDPNPSSPQGLQAKAEPPSQDQSSGPLGALPQR